MSAPIDKSTWRKARLGDVALNATEASRDPIADGYERYVLGKHIPGNGEPIASWGDVGDGHFGSRIRTKIEAGDVICTTRGPQLRVARATFRALGAHTNFVLRTANPQVLDQDYLSLVAQSEHFLNHLAANFRGSVNLFVNWSDAARYEFLLPPIDEQKRIADLLWRLEEYREALARQHAALDKLYVSVLSHHLSGSGDGEDTAITLGKAAEVIMGQSPPSSRQNLEGRGLPFIQGSAEFGEEVPTPVQWCEGHNRVARVGDILISVRAPVGQLNSVESPIAFGRGIAALRASTHTGSDFLRLTVLAALPDLRRHAAGSTFEAVRKEDLTSLRIRMPDKSTREAICDEMNAISASRSAVRDEGRNAANLKNALLGTFFGEVGAG